jgi:hypothetical protein
MSNESKLQECVKRDLISVKRDLISVKRDLMKCQTRVSYKRNL